MAHGPMRYQYQAPTAALLSNLFNVWDGHRNGGAGNGGRGVGGATRKKLLDDVVLNFKLC